VTCPRCHGKGYVRPPAEVILPVGKRYVPCPLEYPWAWPWTVRTHSGQPMFPERGLADPRKPPADRSWVTTERVKSPGPHPLVVVGLALALWAAAVAVWLLLS
jgi:hypothetical protein